MNTMRNRFSSLTILLFVIAFGRSEALADSLSFADRVLQSDGISAEQAVVALGAPDYVYADDAFSAGASVVFGFPAPLDDVTETDLVLHAFVVAESSASTTVRVEARSAPDDAFVEVASFETAEARIASSRNFFSLFDHVHAFAIDFDGRARRVSEVRVTNVAGEPLAIDALEAVHPALSSPSHAVEMRIYRLREDDSDRFALRFKNLGPLDGGVGLSGFSIAHTEAEYIDQTDKPVIGTDGQFEATPETTAGPDNGPHTQRTEYVWSVAGEGLDPGESASHGDSFSVDMDIEGEEFLENILFTVTFLDGTTLVADSDAITTDGETGQLYSLYQYPPGPVSINGPRPAFYYEFLDSAAVAEPICTDCAVGNQNTNTNDNGSDNGNDNDGPSNPPTPRMCAAGMIGPVLLPLLAFALTPPRRSRRRVRH